MNDWLIAIGSWMSNGRGHGHDHRQVVWFGTMVNDQGWSVKNWSNYGK